MVTGENGLTIKHCNCDHFLCKNKWNPLCGRDGQNYTSVCELQKTECLTGKPIGIQHFNECKHNLAAVEYSLSFFKSAVHV